MSLPAKYKLTLTTPTGMHSEQSGTISPERYAVLCGVLEGYLPDDLTTLRNLDEDNSRLYRERDQAMAGWEQTKALLVKYRQHVQEWVGHDCLDSIGHPSAQVAFTPFEVDALRRLAQ